MTKGSEPRDTTFGAGTGLVTINEILPHWIHGRI
jgi:hypothetical protein